ncbi:hypothetical protein SAMN05428989_1791 [Pseudoxanthomonas sp. GM95]|uniref:hypothetical protein n=1 Tax=Pseudoxanthomonas sp. GM95 TaxID=1881043 RepID=UPI0008D04A54|nr:hypothetical protein [Pseudoxanthomonas sp. GM95]SEL50201.1 hypothetical protein SAMN05428989_1791 [Pseudoxanthomonas sp. GM95]
MDEPASQPAASKDRPPRHRWLRRTLWALLIGYGLYAVLGNLYLNTALGPWSINRKPDKFAMHWGRALTWWPGEVVLWKVSMRGHVGRTVWTLQANRASGHVSLTALLGKQVYVPRLQVTDVTGDVQHVEDEIPAPVPQPGGWLLNFPSITSDSLHGGRFHALVLEGEGQAKVGFTKRLRGGPAELLPSTATFQQARLIQDNVALLQNARLEAQFAMPPVTRAQAVGIDKLRFARIGLKIDGDTPALSARQSDAGKLELHLQPGKGHVQGALALSQAALQPGGVLSWRMPVAITDTHGQVHDSTLTAQLSVDQDLHLKANMPAQVDGVLALQSELKIDGTQIPLTDFRALLPRTSGRVAGQWQFSSLKWVTSLFVNVPWLSLEGAGRVEGDVTLDHGVLAPGSRVDVPRVQAQADMLGQRVTGTASAHAQLKQGAKGGTRSIVDVAMSEFSVAALDDLKRPYIQGNSLKLHTESDPDLAKARQSLQGNASFQNARVPDLRAYNRFLPNDHLRFDGGSGTLSGTLALDAAGNAGNGRVRIAGRGAAVHVAGIAMRGDVDVDLKLQRADLAQQRFRVDGSSVALKNVSFAQGSMSRSGWWAQVALPSTQLDAAGKRLAVQGDVTAKMKDVGFLLDLFSQDRDYPKWMVKLVDAGNVQAKARVRWQRRDLVLEGIDASNDRFDLLGRFQLKDRAKPQGDLYARWGVLGTAVELRGGQHQFHVLGARRWYDAQAPYLK